MVVIRRFAPGDEQAVRDLITEIMGEEFRDDQAAYPTDDIQDIARAYGGLGEAFFVAVTGDRLVGTVAIKKEDDRMALMRRLFVAKSHRGKKIGSKLIDRALRFCDEVGYGEVVFRTTSRMKSASKVCEKCGFIQRAKLQLGPVELLKFSLSLRNGAAKS